VTPYRRAELPKSRGNPPRELFYKPQNREGQMTATRAYVRYVLFAIPFAIFAAMASWGLALACVAALVAWDVARWQREKKLGVRLSIDSGRLAIDPRGTGGLAREIPLGMLDDVSLDTRLAKRAGREVRPDGILASGPSFTVDESRILFVVAGGEPYRLTETFHSQSDEAEWLGKIRVFLRAHGWVPADEREAT
jgi:hypothetical protein